MDGDPVTTASCNPPYTYPEPQNQHGRDESLAGAKRLDVWQFSEAFSLSYLRLERKVHLRRQSAWEGRP
jgi:hypothetical protein